VKDVTGAAARRVNLIERSEIDSESEAVSLARIPAAAVARVLLVAHRPRTPRAVTGSRLADGRERPSAVVRFFRSASTRSTEPGDRPRRSHANDVNPQQRSLVHRPPAHKATIHRLRFQTGPWTRTSASAIARAGPHERIGDRGRFSDVGRRRPTRRAFLLKRSDPEATHRRRGVSCDGIAGPDRARGG
jgi:hypothetical protein